MCTKPLTKQFPPSVHDRLLGLNSPRILSFPCGKCAECLKKRQNELMVRCYNEAKSKGSCTFITLTYRPCDIPVAQSVWGVDVQTGEFIPYTVPELVPDPRPASEFGDCSVLRGEIRDYRYKGPVVLYEETDIFKLCEFGVKQIMEEDLSNAWYVRYTPTLYYEDVKLALKRFRKKTGLTNKDFTYVAVGEYGANPVRTMRPHYHLCFFGLTKEQADLFADEWLYGYTRVQQVKFVNEDGSDGLARVSRYIGKYCSKGVFDAYTNKTGCTLRNRLRSSKGLGTNLPKNVIDDLMAFDICKYDPNDPYSSMTAEQRTAVIDAIIRRSFIQIGKFKYALPLSLRRKIYQYQRTDAKSFCRPSAFKGKCIPIDEKAIYSPIYYLVADELRSRLLAESNQEFRQYILDRPSESLSQAVYEFEDYQGRIRENREAAASSSILKFYQQHSKL